MNNPEQDLLTAIAGSKRTLGNSIPRLITRKPQVAMNALKHECSCQSLFMQPSELADYLAVGAETIKQLGPVGISEIQSLQQIIDTNWNFNRAIALQGNLFNFGVAIESQTILAENPDIDEASLTVSAQCNSYLKHCADPYEKLGRHITRMQRSLKLMWTEFKEKMMLRIKRRGFQYDIATCPAYNWYIKLAALADQLIDARQELKEKITTTELPEETANAPETTTSTARLFCKKVLQSFEPLTEETTEIFEEARANGLLTSDEVHLFKQPASA